MKPRMNLHHRILGGRLFCGAWHLSCTFLAASLAIGCGDKPASTELPGAPTEPVSQPAEPALNEAAVPPGLESTPPALAEFAPRQVEEVREFICDPSGVVGRVSIADVANRPGATIDIQATESRCAYDLLFRDGETAVNLSQGKAPGGYLLAVSGVAPSGSAVVCASNIQHSKAGNEAADGTSPRRIDEVWIECARGESGSKNSRFSPLASVVRSDGSWAAWAVGLEESDWNKNAYRLLWIRDFSFQFLNLSNQGRPPEDGVYATEFVFTDLGSVEVGPTFRVSDVIPSDSIVFEGWEPTDAELDEHADYIVYDEGPCSGPAGCPLGADGKPVLPFEPAVPAGAPPLPGK
jgi:hypothetical protein